AIVLIKAGSIPKTSSGKIQRHACRNAFLRRKDLEIVSQWRGWDTEAASTSKPRLSVVSADAPGVPVGANGDRAQGFAQRMPPVSSDTTAVVMEQITRVAKERAKGLTLDSNILEMSMDSLERMEIIAALEDTFSGRFPEEMLPDMVTVRDVVAAVE